MNTLIADDDPVAQRLLAAYLKEHGPCQVVDNGCDAVAAVVKALEDKDPFNLVCLDIHMPKMNGQEALKGIRHAEQEAPGANERARVIMVTAAFDEENVLEGIDDWDAYIVKPIEREALMEEVRRLKLL